MFYGGSPMNFRHKRTIQYYMKKFKPLLNHLICFVLCIVFLITFVCFAVSGKSGGAVEEERTVLRIWQVDGFEGGKGSRADYLQQIGNEFSRENNCYITVTSLSSEAVRLNLQHSNVPDIISYPAGICGLESFINGYRTWCHGGYCLLTLNGDFMDVNTSNTILNSGKENFTKVCALFCGLKGCAEDKPTGAYVKLINNEYKYLLGTQRDIFRLKTRGVAFAVKPITEYNDLYQNISVITSSVVKVQAQKYINFLLSKSGEVTKLGMVTEKTVYDDEMKTMTNLNYQVKLVSAISEDKRKRIENYIESGDINILKSLLN